MAKMASIAGSVVGKIGGNVYSVNSGQQIVRAYQPNVANPNTELQVDNRAKFKLASQLGAVFSPVIAISKSGMVSGRNQFISNTMSHITVVDGTANVQLSALQLTNSQIQLPGLSVSVGANNKITAQLYYSALALGVSKVVYCRFSALSVNKLILDSTQVVSTPGADGIFPADLGETSDRPTFVYAYGIIEGENSILAKYPSYGVDSATFIASLISSRSAAAAGLKATTTRYHVLNQQANSSMAASNGGSSSRGGAKGK